MPEETETAEKIIKPEHKKFVVPTLEFEQPGEKEDLETVEIFFGLTPDVYIPFVPFNHFTLQIFTSDVMDENQGDDESGMKIHYKRRGQIAEVTQHQINDTLNSIKKKGIRFIDKGTAHVFKLTVPYGRYRFKPNEKPLGKCCYVVTVDEIIKKAAAKKISDWRNKYPVETYIPRDKDEKDPWAKGWMPYYERTKKKKIKEIPF